jgi:uncharacterized membrane protein
MSLIAVIVYLIILGALLYCVGLLPIDGTIKTIIRVIVIIAVCLWLLSAFGLMSGGPQLDLPHGRRGC